MRPMTTSATPWLAGRSSVATAAVSSVDPDTSVHDQPTPSRKSATSSSPDQPTCDREASRAATVSTTPPVVATHSPPHRSTAMPHERRQREHAEDVHRDDEADDLQLGVAVLHVDRRHHHDADHDEVAESHDEHRLHGLRPGSHDRDAAAHRAVVVGRVGSHRLRRPSRRATRGGARPAGPRRCSSRGSSVVELPRGQQRVRSQQPVDDEPRQTEPDEREDEGAAELGQPERLGDCRPGTDEVGPDHRADRRGPHDDREVPATARRLREVGGGIPRLVVGGGATPEEEHADDEERERADHGGHEHDAGTDEGER